MWSHICRNEKLNKKKGSKFHNATFYRVIGISIETVAVVNTPVVAHIKICCQFQKKKFGEDYWEKKNYFRGIYDFTL